LLFSENPREYFTLNAVLEVAFAVATLRLALSISLQLRNCKRNVDQKQTKKAEFNTVGYRFPEGLPSVVSVSCRCQGGSQGDCSLKLGGTSLCSSVQWFGCQNYFVISLYEISKICENNRISVLLGDPAWQVAPEESLGKLQAYRHMTE